TIPPCRSAACRPASAEVFRRNDHIIAPKLATTSPDSTLLFAFINGFRRKRLDDRDRFLKPWTVLFTELRKVRPYLLNKNPGRIVYVFNCLNVHLRENDFLNLLQALPERFIQHRDQYPAQRCPYLTEA